MRSTSASRFVDTNVLVYLFDLDSPGKAGRGREILAARENVISTQVLQEFYSSATRMLALPGPDARKAMENFVALCRVVTVEGSLVLSAAKRSETQRLSFWDALIVETAVSAGCSVLLSEDMQEGRAYEAGLHVENPYAGIAGPPTRRRRKASP